MNIMDILSKLDSKKIVESYQLISENVYSSIKTNLYKKYKIKAIDLFF